MAMAARSERAMTVRSRVHGGGAAEARAMVKRTASVAHITPRPTLVVVPRRRRAARRLLLPARDAKAADRALADAWRAHRARHF